MEGCELGEVCGYECVMGCVCRMILGDVLNILFFRLDLVVLRSSLSGWDGNFCFFYL